MEGAPQSAPAPSPASGHAADPLSYVTVDELATEITKHVTQDNAELIGHIIASLRSREISLRDFCKQLRMVLGAGVLVRTLKGLQAAQKERGSAKPIEPAPAPAPAANDAPTCRGLSAPAAQPPPPATDAQSPVAIGASAAGTPAPAQPAPAPAQPSATASSSAAMPPVPAGVVGVLPPPTQPTPGAPTSVPPSVPVPPRAPGAPRDDEPSPGGQAIRELVPPSGPGDVALPREKLLVHALLCRKASCPMPQVRAAAD